MPDSPICRGLVLSKLRWKPNGQVRAFYMNDRWDIALDPIHTLRNAFDPVHAKLLGIEQKLKSELIPPPQTGNSWTTR